MSISHPISPTNPGLSDVFGLLDQWRHFPAYRLEPRVDPFFALFLPVILEDYSGTAMHPEVIPEFPLRRGTLYGEGVAWPNGSKHVDFVVSTQDRATLFLVELKTDMASRNSTQDKYLKQAKQVGLPALVRGIVHLQQRTNKPEKYDCLCAYLSQLGLLDRTGDEPELKIVYIQPTATPPTLQTIDFERVARVVENRGGLGATFAQYLRRWAKQCAGGSARIAAL